MLKHTISLFVVLVAVANAQVTLERESDFFGIPGVDSLSNEWMLDATDSTDAGFYHPIDLEVLKLSPYDYRVVILNRFREPFIAFPMDQMNGLIADDIVHSGQLPIGCDAASSMCQVRLGSFFDPATDRIAVAYEYGATIGLYSFNSNTGQFTLASQFSNPAITKPVGLYWAFDRFFILDEPTQSIKRTDNSGNILSSYGTHGVHGDGFRWISDISGYLSSSNTAHLYVSDGLNGRLDHLTTTSGDQTIHLHSQSLSFAPNGSLQPLNECAYLAGVGIVGYDRESQRLFVWDSADSLQNANRTSIVLPTPIYRYPLGSIHARQICGRIVFVTMTNRGSYTLRSYRVNNATFDDPQPTPNGHWTTAHSPYHVTASIAIPEGGSLTIDPGVTVIFSPGVSLTVPTGTSLVADATAQSPVHLQATSNNPVDAWGGLMIYSNSTQNRLDYCTVENATVGVFVRNGYAQVTNTTIDSCTHVGTAWINSNGLVEGSTLQRNARFGAYVIDSGTHFIDNVITHNHAGGMRFWRAETNNLNSNQIVSNGAAHPEISPYWAGVQILSGSARIQCNRFSVNEGPGLMLFSQTFAEMADQGGRNELTDNMLAFNDLAYDYGELTLMGGLAALACGANTFGDQNDVRYLIRDVYDTGETPPWSVTQNYWETTDSSSIASRLPSGADFVPFLDQDYDCGITMPLCFDDPVELMFWDGWQEERQAQFAAAIGTYEVLVDQYPDKPQAKIALDRIAFCKEAVDYSWSEIREYFQDLAADSTKDSSLVILCKSNAAWCLVEMGEYEEAYLELDSLLDRSDDAYEKMTVALQHLLAELKEDNYAVLSRPPISPRDVGILDEAVCQDLERFEAIDLKVDSLLSSFSAFGHSRIAGAVPTKYALLQNYPNPFNPLTTIRFDLPEAANVELNVFNTLGQHVATVLNERRPAGSYGVVWDGRQVASGMYIYHLRTERFVDAKKMLLIR